MHPIASNRRRLASYVFAWLLVSALLDYLMVALGIPHWEALALVLFLAPVYGGLCLVAWYPCRATPLQSAGILRIAMTQITAAAIFASSWMFLAMAYAALLAYIPVFEHIGEHPGLFKSIFAIGIILYLLSAALHYVLAATERSHQAEQQAHEAQVLARDAELRALKAQINPHFLFNSLHSISALTSVDPARAREMCITLAEFLRSTLGLGEKTLVPLEEEIALVRRFLAVEKVRFGQRLQIEEQIDHETLNCMIPPLLLQPLVENAVGHGIANLPDGGCIKIAINNGEGRLTVSVENDFDPDYRSKRRKGIGIANVRERLNARYGKQSSFDADIVGNQFRVRLTLPAERTTAP
jgi:two-component system sensor histidine kinase AlgZ